MAKALQGLEFSMCTSNWGSALSKLGALTFGYRTQFFLSRPAVPSSIRVKVGGKVVPQGAQGWRYNAQNHAIVFVSSAVPQAGEQVEVMYRAVCLPR